MREIKEEQEEKEERRSVNAQKPVVSYLVVPDFRKSIKPENPL